MKTFKWWLSHRLAWLVCWLRGEKWYVSDNWASVPGNRTAELVQNIWENVVILWASRDDRQELDTIDRDLKELAQIAGESWGHLKRKEPKS